MKLHHELKFQEVDAAFLFDLIDWLMLCIVDKRIRLD